MEMENEEKAVKRAVSGWILCDSDYQGQQVVQAVF